MGCTAAVLIALLPLWRGPSWEFHHVSGLLLLELGRHLRSRLTGSRMTADTQPPLLEHLRALHLEAGRVQEDSVAAHGTRLGSLMQLDLDIKEWESELRARPETDQLTAARRELATALYSASSGLYVHAYAGLRLFLELSFAAVYFSANELHRRKWIGDRKDFSWNKALDESEGVLSRDFVGEFSRSAASDAPTYAADASASYRHCSQFIHGKLAVTQAIPDRLAFSSEVLQDWLVHATKAARAVLYLLYARYGDDLKLDAESRLGPTLESNFSHLRHVRERLGLALDAGGDR